MCNPGCPKVIQLHLLPVKLEARPLSPSLHIKAFHTHFPYQFLTPPFMILCSMLQQKLLFLSPFQLLSLSKILFGHLHERPLSS